MVTTACTAAPSAVVRFSVWLLLVASVTPVVVSSSWPALKLSVFVSLVVRISIVAMSAVRTLQTISSASMSSQVMSPNWLLPLTESEAQVTELEASKVVHETPWQVSPPSPRR